VEQDLIICRALCDLFTNKRLQGKIAFWQQKGARAGVGHVHRIAVSGGRRSAMDYLRSDIYRRQ